MWSRKQGIQFIAIVIKHYTECQAWGITRLLKILQYVTDGYYAWKIYFLKQISIFTILETAHRREKRILNERTGWVKLNTFSRNIQCCKPHEKWWFLKIPNLRLYKKALLSFLLLKTKIKPRQSTLNIMTNFLDNKWNFHYHWELS